MTAISSTTTSTTSSPKAPTAPAPSIPTPITPTVPATIPAWTTIVARSTVATDSWWVVARRVVTGAKILWSGCVRFGLALLQVIGFLSFARGLESPAFLHFLAMVHAVQLFADTGFCRVVLVNPGFIEMQNLFVTARRHRECLPGQ